MKKVALSLSMLLAALSATPAFCQLGGDGYHFSGGGARVVTQSKRAYTMPGLTAISPGTLSKSAQGMAQVGEQINPGLPSVRWGSTISTAGDMQYRNGFQTGQQRRVDVPNVAGTAIINSRLPGCNWGGSTGTAGDAIRSDFHPEVNTNNNMWWHPPKPQVRANQYVAPPAPATYDGPGGGGGALTY